MICTGFNNVYDINNQKSKIASYNEKYKCKYTVEKCSTIVSKSINLRIDCSKSEHKRDIILNKTDYIRIIGSVLDENFKEAKSVYITLYKFQLINYKTEYIPIADTISDEEGMFQFIIPNDNFLGENFKVKVSDKKNEFC